MAACGAQFTPMQVSWQQVSAACGLLVLSGLFSGLTLGLMSLDIRELELVITGGEALKRRQAERILPLRKRGNLLLCTLLLGNTLVNSGIAILTASFTGGVIGGAASTAFILIFGEIVPQSVCSRYGLAAGAKTVDIIRIFILLLFPVAWPLSKVLDRVLGEELGTIYSRHELKELFSMQAKQAAAAAENGESFGPGGEAADGGQGGDGQEAIQEATVSYMSGILSLSERTAEMIMTQLDDVFALFTDERLDFPNMSRIYASGYTRVPVFRRITLQEGGAAGTMEDDSGALLLDATAAIGQTRQVRTQSEPQGEVLGRMMPRSASDNALDSMARGHAADGSPPTASGSSQPNATSSTRGGAVAGDIPGGVAVGLPGGAPGILPGGVPHTELGAGANGLPAAILATVAGGAAGGEAAAGVELLLLAETPIAALRRPPLVVPMAGMPVPALSVQPPSPTANSTPGDAPLGEAGAGNAAAAEDAAQASTAAAAAAAAAVPQGGSSSPGNSRHGADDVGGGGRGNLWRGHEVAGLLSAKDLILVDPEDALSVEQLVASCGREVMMVKHDTPVNALFKEFTRGHSHLAFVQRRTAKPGRAEAAAAAAAAAAEAAEAAETASANTDGGGADALATGGLTEDDYYDELVGIVTLEDVLEELIQAEIVDESDVYMDNVSKRYYFLLWLAGWLAAGWLLRPRPAPALYL